MLLRARHRLLVASLLMAAGMPAARAQVQVSPEAVLQLKADASVGYVYSTAQYGRQAVNFGFGADLSGYYHHPNFLQFDFSPYYNQGREYSTADFISGDKGFATSVNLFTGSNIPLFINYSKSMTHTGMFGLVGTEASVVGEGSNDNLNINWTLRLHRLPTIQFGYLRSGSDYKVFGTHPSFGKGHASGYQIASQYTLVGFALGVSFSSQGLKQLLPDVLITSQQKQQTNTDQKNLLFTASRQITKNTFLDASASRAHWTTDATSLPQDRTYDTVLAGVSARPLAHLAANFRMNYVSDLSALLLGSVLPGNTSNGNPGTGSLLLISPETRTRFLTYTGGASYEVTPGLNLRSSVRRGTGNYSGRSETGDTTWDSGVTYMHGLARGRLSLGYAVGIYNFKNGTTESSSRGQSGSVAYAKPIRGWEYSGVFQYSTSAIEAFLPGNYHTLSAEMGANGLVRGWRLSTSFRFERSDSIFNVQTKNRREMLRTSLSRSRLTVSGSIQFGSGLSILSLAGLRPASVAEASAAGSELERLLIPTESSAVSFTLAYQLRKRTMLNGGWSRMNYQTLQTGPLRENQLEQMDVHIRHVFRQLDFRAGFRRYHQVFTGIGGLYNANTIYFQVSRHFDVF